MNSINKYLSPHPITAWAYGYSDGYNGQACKPQFMTLADNREYNKGYYEGLEFGLCTSLVQLKAIGRWRGTV